MSQVNCVVVRSVMVQANRAHFAFRIEPHNEPSPIDASAVWTEVVALIPTDE